MIDGSSPTASNAQRTVRGRDLTETDARGASERWLFPWQIDPVGPTIAVPEAVRAEIDHGKFGDPTNPGGSVTPNA